MEAEKVPVWFAPRRTGPGANLRRQLFAPCTAPLESRFAGRLVGFDVNETCPPYDNGNTSAVAAREVREVIAVREAQTARPWQK